MRACNRAGAKMIVTDQSLSCHPVGAVPCACPGEGSGPQSLSLPIETDPKLGLRVATYCQSWSFKFIIALLHRSAGSIGSTSKGETLMSIVTPQQLAEI